MTNLAIFDFDGTLVDIGHLHRRAWQQTITDIGLFSTLADLLPEERFPLERADSKHKIRERFLSTPANRRALTHFFKTDDDDAIVEDTLDLKEAHLLHVLNDISPGEMINNYAGNIFRTIQSLHSKGYELGIIASARESVIMAALRICLLDDYFSFIVGEESMRDPVAGVLEKQDASVRNRIPRAALSEVRDTPCYIGDDVRVDSLLAKNYGFRFIQLSNDRDFMQLEQWL